MHFSPCNPHPGNAEGLSTASSKALALSTSRVGRQCGSKCFVHPRDTSLPPTQASPPHHSGKYRGYYRTWPRSTLRDAVTAVRERMCVSVCSVCIGCSGFSCQVECYHVTSLSARYRSVPGKICKSENDIYESPRDSPIKTAEACKNKCTADRNCLSAQWYAADPLQCDLPST